MSKHWLSHCKYVSASTDTFDAFKIFTVNNIVATWLTYLVCFFFLLAYLQLFNNHTNNFRSEWSADWCWMGTTAKLLHRRESQLRVLKSRGDGVFSIYQLKCQRIVHSLFYRYICLLSAVVDVRCTAQFIILLGRLVGARWVKTIHSDWWWFKIQLNL